MSPTRRTFVSGAVGLGVGSLAFAGCRERPVASAVKDDNATNNNKDAVASLRVRRSVSSLDPNGPELNDYRTAIKAMMALDPSDNRSWEGQAQVHNNSCPHGNWFFVTWHRTYLMWFEKMIQKFSGNPNWSLPYWDWSTSPQMPPAFADQTNGNPLFHPRGFDGTFDPQFVGPDVVANIMGLTDFIAFGGTRSPQQRGQMQAGTLENTPHNFVHATLGGPDGSFDMGNFTSPRDPIFWLHHANVDRIWSEWALAHPDTALPANPTGLLQRRLSRDFWLKFPLTGYFDLENKAVTATPADNLTTVAYGYQYDTPASQSSAGASLRLTDSGSTAVTTETSVLVIPAGAVKITRSNPFVTFAITVTSAMQAAFADYQAATAANPASTCVRLYADNIPVPSDLTQTFRLFLNLPALSPSTPNSDDHFVSEYAFFGAPHPEHGGFTRGAVFDLKRVFGKLFSAAAPIGAELDFQVQLYSAPGAAMPPPSVFSGIKLSIEFSRIG